MHPHSESEENVFCKSDLHLHAITGTIALFYEACSTSYYNHNNEVIIVVLLEVLEMKNKIKNKILNMLELQVIVTVNLLSWELIF